VNDCVVELKYKNQSYTSDDLEPVDYPPASIGKRGNQF
jgi:hypothetical protein